MQELEIALKKFCSVLGRNGGDRNIPIISNTKNNYPAFLSDAVDTLFFFYNHVFFDKPIFIGGSLMFEIEPLTKLENAQYGWRSLKNNITNPIGNQSLLVIGNRNGDAILIDIKQVGCPVYGCITGSHNMFFIASSLAKFFDVISDWLECEYVEFNMETCDDDGEPNPAFQPRLEELSQSKLNEEEFKGFFKFFFG